MYSEIIYCQDCNRATSQSATASRLTLSSKIPPQGTSTDLKFSKLDSHHKCSTLHSSQHEPNSTPFLQIIQTSVAANFRGSYQLCASTSGLVRHFKVLVFCLEPSDLVKMPLKSHPRFHSISDIVNISL